MYSKNAWGGPIDPFILVKFTDVGKDQEGDPIVSLVVFEWKDEEYIGILPSPDATQKTEICDPLSVESGYCNMTDIGKFILAPNATEQSDNLIYTGAVHLKEPGGLNYQIKKTGYYCVLTYPYSASSYEALVEFRNAYGELPATQIPKLPFYGGITILYALVLAYVNIPTREYIVLTTRRFWGFLYFQHRSDICKRSACLFDKASLLTLSSGRAKLHNGNSRLPCHRDANDLGLLW
jgi:hypothetical protein